MKYKFQVTDAVTCLDMDEDYFVGYEIEDGINDIYDMYSDDIYIEHSECRVCRIPGEL